MSSEATVVDPAFSAEDADLSFVSSDNVTFKVHSNNLQCICGGFAPQEFRRDDQEVTSLSEDSATLKVLFQFVYPREHPDLEDIKFDQLMKVAEAAEKYQVFSALGICRIRLRENAHLAPTKVFVYGFLHDRRDLVAKAAPYMQDTPLKEMAGQLPPALLAAWVEYYEKRRALVMESFVELASRAPSISHSAPNIGNVAPNIGNAAPNIGNSAPNIGNSAPNIGNSPTSFGAFGAFRVQTPGNSNRHVIAEAMLNFYEKNASTTSLKGLRTAIKQAFHAVTAVMAEPHPSAFGIQDSNGAKDRIAEDLLNKLEAKLNPMSDFGAFIRR